MIGKWILVGLQWIIDGFFLVKDVLFYKIQNKSPSVVLCLANPGSIGGTEMQIQLIAQDLKKRLGDCLVLIYGRVEERSSNRFLRRLKSLKIPVVYLGKWGLIDTQRSFYFKKAIIYFLRFLAPTGKIFHFFNPLATILASSAKAAGFQIFYTETGMPDQGEGWKIFYSRGVDFDCVMSVSQVGLDRFKCLFKYEGPSYVIPSMMDRFPCKSHLKNPSFHLVYVGRLTPLKGVDRLIRSFAHLLKQLPHAKFSLIGSGESFFDLKDQVEDLHISDRVDFIGWVEHEKLFTYLSSADLFCLPSETEGLPTSILEAMSMGIPVLATDVGGVSEIVEHGVSGILIPPRDEEALTQALCQLATDPVLCNRLGEGAFSSWQKLRSRGEIMNSLMAAYGFA